MGRASELQSGAAVHGWLSSGAAPGLCTLWCIFSFSVILWLGDLNYRLEELDVAKVKQLVEEKAFPELCQYDQVLVSHLHMVLRVLGTNHTAPWPFLCSLSPFYSIWKLCLRLSKIKVFIFSSFVAEEANEGKCSL